MGNHLEWVYARYSNPGLIFLAEKKGLDFDWVIEAGCHDGSDTINFLKLPKVKTVFAFEPDDEAANNAEIRFSNYFGRVQLKRIALMDQPGYVRMDSPTGTLGDGSTIFRRLDDFQTTDGQSAKLLKCSTLDLEIPELNSNGLMWLDVEGSANLVLKGAERVLRSVILLQVEVNTHSSKHIESNFWKVNKIMRSASFLILYFPLHPGYFGDVIYIKSSELNPFEKLRSYLLQIVGFFVHRIIYPILNKPRD